MKLNRQVLRKSLSRFVLGLVHFLNDMHRRAQASTYRRLTHQPNHCIDAIKQYALE